MIIAIVSVTKIEQCPTLVFRCFLWHRTFVSYSSYLCLLRNWCFVQVSLCSPFSKDLFFLVLLTALESYILTWKVGVVNSELICASSWTITDITEMRARRGDRKGVSFWENRGTKLSSNNFLRSSHWPFTFSLSANCSEALVELSQFLTSPPPL